MTTRTLTYAQALSEATDQAMQLDPSVFVVGQGTRDPGQIFGTVNGLFQKYGPDRVMEMPLSEEAVMGMCMGAALNGLRPVYVLQRVDFLTLALDPLLNHASKWHFMFNRKVKVPLVIRCIIGKGWGQGPQHSQAIHAPLSHFPGLRVALPTTPEDAKGILLNAIFGSDPVVILEGRSLHSRSGPVPEAPFTRPLGKARVIRPGTDVTIAACCFAVPEAEQAAEALEKDGVSAEVVDILSTSPLDVDTVAASVEKTGRLVVADVSWSPYGVASELSAAVQERLFGRLKAPPVRVTPPFCPAPTAAALEALYYPTSAVIAERARGLVGVRKPAEPAWTALPAEERLRRALEAARGWDDLRVVSAPHGWEVLVDVVRRSNVGQEGRRLMRFEEHLRKELGAPIEVYAMEMKDLSKLRQGRSLQDLERMDDWLERRKGLKSQDGT